jgi:hypothetical protein
MNKLAVIAAFLTVASTADARPLLGSAVAAAAAGAAAGATAAAGAGASTGGSNCQSAGICPKNGPQLTGIAPRTAVAKRPVVNAVTLPSGEAVELR